METNENYSDYVYVQLKNSSVLHSCAWAEKLEALIVVFNSGSVWLYTEATYEIYQNLIKATSAGNYFNLNIRNTLNGELVYKVGSYNEQKA
jgi:hypothetical protein